MKIRNKEFAKSVSTAALSLLVATPLLAVGARQSPIDIATSSAVEQPSVVMAPSFASSATLDVFNTYKPSGTLDREWATLRANVPAGSKLKMGSVTYDLLQFHFHTPSEHKVDGMSAPMEVHFVFLRHGVLPSDRNPDALLVIGAGIMPGKANAELGKIFNSATLPQNSTMPHLKVSNFNLNNVLGRLNPSWRYGGSLTAPASFAPTCDEPEGTITDQLTSDVFPENVSWIVLQTPIQMSYAQIAKFRSLFPKGNSRPVQPLQGRSVGASVRP